VFAVARCRDEGAARNGSAHGGRSASDCRATASRAASAPSGSPISIAHSAGVRPASDYEAPARFTAQIELPTAVQTLEPLGHALALLLGELSGFLRARDGGIQSLQLDLVHHAPPVTQVSLELARPQRGRAHLLELVTTRLERVVLRAPVLSLRLRSGPVLRVDPRTAELFGDRARQASASPDLIERLRARLGAQAVHGVGPRPEHRPEAAWGSTEPTVEGAASNCDVRAPSRALEAAPHNNTVHRSRPPAVAAAGAASARAGGRAAVFEGRLELLRGPERIETGWWDDARDPRLLRRGQSGGCGVWIYREREGERRGSCRACSADRRRPGASTATAPATTNRGAASSRDNLAAAPRRATPQPPRRSPSRMPIHRESLAHPAQRN
jgi:protein ImuB